jgi:hypothetical protein
MQSTEQQTFYEDAGLGGDAGYPASPSGPAAAVKTRLWMAITSCFLFLPLGAFAVAQSVKVSSRLVEGDVAGAVKASSMVKRLFIISIVLCLLFFILELIALSSASHTTYYTYT